jgi:hypothetical protein
MMRLKLMLSKRQAQRPMLPDTQTHQLEVGRGRQLSQSAGDLSAAIEWPMILCYAWAHTSIAATWHSTHRGMASHGRRPYANLQHSSSAWWGRSGEPGLGRLKTNNTGELVTAQACTADRVSLALMPHLHPLSLAVVATGCSLRWPCSTNGESARELGRAGTHVQVALVHFRQSRDQPRVHHCPWVLPCLPPRRHQWLPRRLHWHELRLVGELLPMGTLHG